MDAQATLWALGIIVTVLIAIAGALFVHVKEDAKQRERVATLEERTGAHGSEIRSLREKLHDFKEEVRRLFLETFKR